MVYSYIENDIENNDDGELLVMQDENLDKLLDKILHRFICQLCRDCENKDFCKYITYRTSKNAIILNLENKDYAHYATIIGKNLDFHHIRNYLEKYMESITDEEIENIYEEGDCGYDNFIW